MGNYRVLVTVSRFSKALTRVEAEALKKKTKAKIRGSGVAVKIVPA